MSDEQTTILNYGENIKIEKNDKKIYMSIYEKVKYISMFFYDIAGFFVLWVTIHFMAANLYSRFCAEPTLLGYIKSIFIAQAPHCIAMRWIIYNGGNVINSMWLSIAMWLTTKVFNKIIQ